MIRPAHPSDAVRQRAIERAAGARFVTVGMPEVAADEPMSDERLAAYATAGRSWVATEGTDLVVGYVVVDEVEQWAADQGWGAMTLTTFRYVPWNRPLYEHLGS